MPGCDELDLEPLDCMDGLFGFGEIYSECYKDLVFYVRTKYKSLSDHEDIVHDAFLKVMSARRTKVIGNPRAYLYKVVNSIAIDRIRRKELEDSYHIAYRHAALEPPAADVSPLEAELIEDQDRVGLVGFIAELPEKCRKVFVMCKLEEKSHAEIARELGMSVFAVEKHIVRGLARCRECAYRHAA